MKLWNSTDFSNSKLKLFMQRWTYSLNSKLYQQLKIIPSIICRMTWLFANEKILLPSVYLQQRLSASQRVGLVRGRVQEAVRLARKSRDPDVRVFAYYWYRYQDQRDLFVDKVSIIIHKFSNRTS